ncbi:MAG: hypothetical protein P8Q19_03095, partial [Planktomarina sp.]|nr:hypothetical protein [Planktomarina sp.]
LLKICTDAARPLQPGYNKGTPPALIPLPHAEERIFDPGPFGHGELLTYVWKIRGVMVRASLTAL